MNNLQFTKHATTRSQQRGIDQEAVSIIMKYGHCSHVGGDTKSWSMSKQEKRYARGDLGKAFTKIEKKPFSFSFSLFLFPLSFPIYLIKYFFH